MNGKFLTLEGIDGAGKSTVINFVSACLSKHGIKHITTREPGGTKFGEALRTLLLHGDAEVCADAETLLMFAARAQHLNEVIRPALARGAWVVCDRFTDATYAYQGGGRGVDAARIAELESWTQDDLRPDLTLLLDAAPATAAARADGGDRFEREDKNFTARVRENYLARQRSSPSRVHLVDSAQELPAVRAAVEKIMHTFIANAR